jgi:hypothetical protein
VTLTLRAQGHPAIRATHAKTLELTPATELGAGGTCIVGVGMVVHGSPLAGWVRAELTVGGERIEFDALANPGWDETGPAVIRRSDVRKPDTIATHATLASADLPRSLVAALASPAADVGLVLRAVSPQPPRVVIVAEGPLPPAEVAAAGGSRVLVHGPAAPEVLLGAPQPVEVYGLPIHRAVAAASPGGAGAVLSDLGSLSDRSLRGEALLVRVPTSELERTIRMARRHGRRTGAVAGRLPWVWWGLLEDIAAPAGVRTMWLCLDPMPERDLDQRIAELRAAGASTKSLARELALEFGLSVKEVYGRALH